MKNIVIIIKNLPDELVEDAWKGGLKEFEIEGKQEVTIDFNAAPVSSKARTVEAIIMLQSNYVFQEISKMPIANMVRMIKKVQAFTFEKLFGKFNQN
jgi:hypothetical protein